MQQVRLSPGKALCRFCGEHVPTNRLSTHIAKEHPRPVRSNAGPALVRTRKTPPKSTSK